MPHKDKALFLGFFEGWRWQMAVNRPDSTYLVFDKLIFSRYLRDCGIPQPACLGTFGVPRGFADGTAGARARSDFERFLAEDQAGNRSEEHTSELPSLMRISYAVFCLKKQNHETDT